MATKKSVIVHILDQEFKINTDADPARVRKIADFLNENLKQVQMKSKSGSPYNAAILTALNITEMYFDAVEKQNRLRTEVTERTKKALGLLESSSDN